jgi:transposase
VAACVQAIWIASAPSSSSLGAAASADMINSHWDGIAAYCKPENKVSLGFVEGLNNKIRVFQRRAYGLRDDEYLRLKVLTCMLPPL